MKRYDQRLHFQKSSSAIRQNHKTPVKND